MQKSDKTQDKNEAGIAGLNSRIESTEALQQAAEGGKVGRTRTVRGKEQTVNQTTIFDEIDRFQTVSTKIATGSVVDSSIRDALETIQIVAQRLDDDNLSPQERKGLSAYLDVADKQIATADDSGMSDDDKKLYAAKVGDVKSEIANFRDLSEQGKRSYDGTKTFIENAKDDATGLLIAGLTRNPALMIAHNLYAGYRNQKKKSIQDAEAHHKSSLRNKKKTLEDQKTALGEGAKIVDDANVDMGDLSTPDFGGDEPLDMTGIVEAFREGFTDALGDLGDLMSPAGADMMSPSSDQFDLLLGYSDVMANSLQNIETALVDGNEFDKNQARIDAENFAEMRRNGADGTGKNKKSRLKERKVEGESLLEDLMDLAETGAIVGTAAGMMKERGRKKKDRKAKGGKGKLAKGFGKLKGMRGIGGIAIFLASFGMILLDTIKGAFAPFMKIFSKIGDILTPLIGSFKKIFSVLGRFVRPLLNLGKVLFAVGKMVAGPITLLFSMIAGLMNVFEHWGDTEGQDLLDRIFSSIGDFFGGIIDMFTGIFVDDPEAFRKKIVDSIMGLFTRISDWWDDLDILGSLNDWLANSWLGKKLGMEGRDPEAVESFKRMKKNARMREDGVNAIVEESSAFYEKWLGDGIQINDNADLSKTNTNTLKDLYTDDRLTDEASAAIKAELDKRGVSMSKVEMQAENLSIEMSPSIATAIVDDSKDYSNESIGDNSKDYSNESIPNVNDNYDINSQVRPNPDYVKGSIQPIPSMELKAFEELQRTIIMDRQQEAANAAGNGQNTVINNTTNNSQGVINQENSMPVTSPLGDTVRNYRRQAL